MNSNRIQKLLFNEYSDFEDIVLLESPFTETTRDGIGLRQVQMGLTTTKLILATDILKSYDSNASFAYCLEAGRIGIDPEIESLELVSLFPVEVVNLSVYRRKDRHTLKAHFCNDTVLFFELSGSEKRNMFWNLWLERIDFLSPDDCSSIPSSESCGGSTSSTSTLYIVGSQLTLMEPGRAQLLCYYNHGPPVNISKRIGNFKSDTNLDHRNHGIGNYTQTSSQSKHHMNNFLSEGKLASRLVTYDRICKSSVNLYEKFLSDDCLGDMLENKFQVDINPYDSSDNESLDMYELIESSIQMWEKGLKEKKHARRYALSTKPHFLHGLGPWKLTKGDKYSVQIKRSVSMVNIQRQPTDKSLHVNVSKRQLTNTISCEALHVMPEQNYNYCLDSKILSPTSPVVFFWTTNYWYRPQSASAAYGELQSHLKRLKQMQSRVGLNSRRKQVRRKVKGARKAKLRGSGCRMIEAIDAGTEKMKKLSSTSCTVNSGLDFCACGITGGSSSMVVSGKSVMRTQHLASSNTGTKITTNQNCSTCPIAFLRQILKPKQKFRVWDFPTPVLAQQLTMIDRNLFLRVSVRELGALIVQQCSRNAPNISALIAFSHRMSCLVTTEVLREQSVHMRARSITRFIDIADICSRWKNFQSTQSILYGLCSPPVYRLSNTWAYLRRHHGNKNRRMVEMCQQFRDPRMPTSQLIFTDGHATPPFLPSLSHLMIVLLNRMEDYPDELLERHCSRAVSRKQETFQALQSHNKRKVIPNSIRRIFSAFRFQRSECNLENTEQSKYPDEPQNSNSESCQSTSIESKLNLLISPIMDKYESNCKLKRFESICFSLLHWQRAAMMYTFKGSENAVEYLLKARYLEERENFQISLNIEKN